MLLAVEGGGFFSSSATGYSKGLSLLLLGHKDEERPMKVSPWNQYRLVDQVLESDVQLASKKGQPSHGCASFLCFGRGSPETDKVARGGAANYIPQSEARTNSSSASGKGHNGTNIAVDADKRKVLHKSSLKKPSRDCFAMVGAIDEARNSLEELKANDVCSAERRRVHWTDNCGRDLTQIREFEVSDEIASDEDPEHDSERRCQCVIQ